MVEDLAATGFSILLRRAMVKGFSNEAMMYSGLICMYILVFLIGAGLQSTYNHVTIKRF